MKEGELSAPFKIKDRHTIIHLIESRGTELTSDIRKKIVNEQMSSFIDYGVEQLLDHAHVVRATINDRIMETFVKIGKPKRVNDGRTTQVEPFSKLSKSGKEMLTDGLRWDKYTIGERIYRQDEMPSRLHYIVKREARLLVESLEKFTNNATEEGEGTLIGWAGLVRGEACETVQTSMDETISFRVRYS